MQFTIIGRRWFEKVNGNTYHSVEVYKDGELLQREAFDYGYGDHYQQCALNIIKNKALVLKEFEVPELETIHSLWQLKNLGHTLVTSVTDVSRKRDL